VTRGALGARCDYCGADNLVEIPRDWVTAAGKLVKRVAVVEGAAAAEVDRAFSELRTSLILRLILGLVLTVPPAAMFLFTGGDEGLQFLGFDLASADAFKPPDELPRWKKEYVPSWSCSGEGGMFFQRKLDHCTEGGLCMDGQLVALRGKRPFHVFVREPAAVQLDARDTEMFDVTWKRVDMKSAGPAGATFTPPLTGWYRVLVIRDQPGWTHVCETQE
jgi:hypothetical protein